ncbi:hypothetical protein KSP39_PZI019440 [Platanthera zijinensis]|uniref:Transposase (putative) gypsy type domain-containing protein n=1 Tax=Platanthera zijinensis TaxID=2320716 RepID=A0AAP0B1D4_9ASPA
MEGIRCWRGSQASIMGFSSQNCRATQNLGEAHGVLTGRERSAHQLRGKRRSVTIGGKDSTGRRLARTVSKARHESRAGYGVRIERRVLYKHKIIIFGGFYDTLREVRYCCERDREPHQVRAELHRARLPPPPLSFNRGGVWRSVVAKFPPEFVARNPGSEDRVNFMPEGELAIPLEHFEVGFRLPLWPEVRQALRYNGVVPAQLDPNSVALLVAFACYMCAERIEFNLFIFQKLFNFRAKSGIVFFSGQTIKTSGLTNKNHNWPQKFIFVSGNFGNVPLSPIRYDEATYKPPALEGRETTILNFFGTKNIDAKFLQRDLDSLPPAYQSHVTLVSPQPLQTAKGTGEILISCRQYSLPSLANSKVNFSQSRVTLPSCGNH